MFDVFGRQIVFIIQEEQPLVVDVLKNCLDLALPLSSLGKIKNVCLWNI